MERRVLLAVFLSFLVLVLYQRWIGPQPVPVVPGRTEPADSPTAAVDRTEFARRPNASEAPSATLTPTSDQSAIAPPEAGESFEAVVSDDRARDIIVENEFVRAVFATRGAKLVSWQLKGYADENGDPVELVPPSAPPGRAWPFSLVVPGDPGDYDAARRRAVPTLRRRAPTGSRRRDPRLQLRRQRRSAGKEDLHVPGIARPALCRRV